MPALGSKLRPPLLRSGSVPRPVLVDRIRARHRTHPIAILEAGAGYGKTTVAAELAGSDARAVGWYTLDELDNDPTVFLTYLAGLLERCGGPSADVAGVASPNGRIQTIAARVRTAFRALPSPVLVVVDNVHLLEYGACLQFLGAVASGLPLDSQLVLLQRHDAGVALGDGSRIVRLGVEDLRLSAHEARALLHAVGVDMEPHGAAQLTERCGGWAAGIYLTAKAGQPALQQLLADDTAAVHPFVDEYFHDELLDGLDADTYSFLRAASLVDPISAELADAFLGRTDSGVRLAELARLNLFVSHVDDRGEWYALHPLLRELLRAEMRVADPERSNALLSRATDWFERRGDLEAAADCAIAANDRERVATLVSTAALPAFWQGRETAVDRWLGEVDEPGLLLAHPELAVVGSGLLAIRGWPDKAARWAAVADEVDSARSMADGSPAAAWKSFLRAFLCRDGAAQMLADAQAARALLAPMSPLASALEACHGYALLLTGDGAEAESAFTAAADTAVRNGSHVGASVALAMLSLQTCRRGDVQTAQTFAADAADAVRAGRLDEYMSTSLVHAAAARCALANGRTSAARTALDLAVPLAQRVPYALPWFATVVLLELAHSSLAVGDVGRARELVASAEDVAVRRPGLGAAEAWIASLRQDLRAGRSVVDGWTSPLTAAELRLLPLLPSYLSFRDIAVRLGISRNTVKTQAISIYRKLGVASRTEAVERARGLGLLEEPSPPAGDE